MGGIDWVHNHGSWLCALLGLIGLAKMGSFVYTHVRSCSCVDFKVRKKWCCLGPLFNIMLSGKLGLLIAIERECGNFNDIHIILPIWSISSSSNWQLKRCNHLVMWENRSRGE